MSGLDKFLDGRLAQYDEQRGALWGSFKRNESKISNALSNDKFQGVSFVAGMVGVIYAGTVLSTGGAAAVPFAVAGLAVGAASLAANIAAKIDADKRILNPRDRLGADMDKMESLMDKAGLKDGYHVKDHPAFKDRQSMDKLANTPWYKQVLGIGGASSELVAAAKFQKKMMETDYGLRFEKTPMESIQSRAISNNLASDSSVSNTRPKSPGMGM